MTLIGKLIVAIVALGLWSGFTTYRWSTASSRCDARLAEQRLKDAHAAAQEQAEALNVAAGIYAEERGRIRGEQGTAAGNTHTRETLIREVAVTGQCVMPAGLPSLAPAVKEARDAAQD